MHETRADVWPDRIVGLTLLVLCALGPTVRTQETAPGPAPKNPDPEQMNEAFGLPLWADDLLWDDDDRDVGQRLQWPEESRTRFVSTHRIYPPPTTRVLGVRPYSMAFYAEGGRPTRVSLFFINKGDFEGFLNPDERKSVLRDAVRAFENALQADAERLAAVLSALLGDPGRAVTGDRALRERVLRWDWRGHAFLLARQSGEYVALRIIPAVEADDRGRAEKISDSEMRRRLAERVQRRENGDVIITDIPMVEQGPKGYCVPATWERYLRYLGIPSDMYALAMVGETRRGGGTETRTMVSNIQSLVALYRRNIRTFSGGLSWPKVTRYLDEGIPVMWVMRLDLTFDQALTARAKERAAVKDLAEWKRRLALYRKGVSRLRRGGGDDDSHMCLIIGYNTDTDELAISDSWGREYEERWITVEEAEAISRKEFMAIGW